MSSISEQTQLTSTEVINVLSSPDLWQELESRWAVEVTVRGDLVEVTGEDRSAVQSIANLVQSMDLMPKQGMLVTTQDAERFLKWLLDGKTSLIEKMLHQPFLLKLRRKTLVPKTLTQKLYLQSLVKDTIVFGIGPAGTGKTYLAVAAAVQALLVGDVKRIVLTRPAVEAGEALGFLPGDLTEKILPYLRPLYDALYDLVGKSDVEKMIERGVLEIAPLAYMRGRTLDDCYVILDEAQNTTAQQMKMFLTRLGNRGRMAITGDVTQTDLPHKQISGLRQAQHILPAIDGVTMFQFSAQEVVRHPLVAKIIAAYDELDAKRS